MHMKAMALVNITIIDTTSTDKSRQTQRLNYIILFINLENYVKNELSKLHI